MIRVVRFSKHTWAIQSTQYSPALYYAARMVPGMTWEPASRTWCGFIDAVDTCVAALRAKGIRVDGKPLLPASLDAPSALPVALSGARDYQKEAIRFLLREAPTGALLADDMGLGKSLCALRAARALRLPTVVVCPAFVQGVWGADEGSESFKWWREAWPPRVLEGVTGMPLEPAPLTICNDSILYAWAPHMLWCRVLILDECHHFSNDRSRRSKAIRLLANVASHRIGLSGTPMTNRPKDLWNVVDTLSEGRFGKFFGYALRHCEAHREEVAKDKVVWKFDGASNLEELRRRLDFFMLRRTKADAKLELPPKTRQLIYVDVKRKALAPVRNLVVDGKINDKAFRKALDMAADGKLADVVGLVNSHIEEGHRVVVFTYRRAVAEFVCNALLVLKVGATFIHGELGQAERQKRMKAPWQVLCATIDVTAGGISLTQADVGVFAEMTYEPHELLQCEARLSRPGATGDQTLIQYVLARGTADELVARVVIDKLDVFEKAIGGTGEGWQNTMRGETDRKKILKSLAARLAAQDAV